MTAFALQPHELIIDNFAGGGGASFGIKMATGRSPDIAINHDPEALALHASNHPETRHFRESVWDIDPLAVTEGRPVGLAWFSPDCKHFSKAKGGKPVEKAIRGLAWVVIRWAQSVKPRVIFLENVEEFQTWGPLLADGTPDPKRKGFTFRRWLRELRKAGYKYDMRELRACDYGTPTTRKRLFVVARCDGAPIVWPKPTHRPAAVSKDGIVTAWAQGHGLTLADLQGMPLYRTAAECIDWTEPMCSIFATPEQATAWAREHGREKPRRPLAENTLNRIARGLDRYVINAAEPFIVPLTHHGDRRPHALGDPLPTITGAHRGEHALIVSNMTANVPRPVSEPVSTILTGDHKYLAVPYVARIAQTGGNGKYANDMGEPLTTIVSKAEHLLVSPTLVQTGYGEREGQAPRSLDLHAPLGTAVAQGVKHALVGCFLAKHYGGHEATGSRLTDPIDTVTSVDHHAYVAVHMQRDFGASVGSDIAAPAPTTTAGGSGHQAIVASHVMKLRGGLGDHQTTAQDMREPMPTLTAGGTHVAAVNAFLVKYFGTDQDPRLDGPLHTITTRDRFGLVTVAGEDYQIVDIGMRMLTPRELYRAQGFPDSYRIDVEHQGRRLSKTAQVRMVGNSVCPPLAAALVAANVGEVASDARARA